MPETDPAASGDLKARRTFDDLDATIHRTVAQLNQARYRDPLNKQRISAEEPSRPLIKAVGARNP